MSLDRYQIGNEDELHHTGSFAAAVEAARRIAARGGKSPWIFDRMAHHGRYEKWVLTPAGDAYPIKRRD